ncbi:MAG TPA: C1 family peptidase [Pirellulales bacterium]|nr:C1 family peptidase [Pirellulales bacterium]
MRLHMRFTVPYVLAIQLAANAIVFEITTPFSLAADALQAKVDLTPEFQRLGLPAHAQGNSDVCSLFAVTGVADFENARHGPGKQPCLSEEFLIWAARQATGKDHDQAMFYEAVQGLNVLGICDEALMPYAPNANPNSGPPRRPSPKAIADARQRAERWQVHWIRRWDVSRPMSDAQFQGIKRTLAKGHPVACGLRWPNKLKGSSIVSESPPGGVFDGHSIAFVGYTDDAAAPGGGTLRFRNSFGANWGNHGYGVMSYAYVRKYANDAIWLALGKPGSERPAERFEAAGLPIVEHRSCETQVQKMADFEPKLWTQGRQLFCGAKKGGDVLLAFDVREAGRYRVRLLATAAPDYGRLAVALDGAATAATFDLYSGRVSPSGSLELGQHDLAAGRHRLRCMAVGKNPASGGFYFGLDAIDLMAVK